MTQPRPLTITPVSNVDLPWDEFDTGDYLEHNYRNLRDDDQQIIGLVGEFFELSGVCGARGIDVGTGANLYPALAMLPFCRDITLWERSSSNVDWLRSELPRYDALWDPFWCQLTARRAYAEIDDPRGALAEQAAVRHGDVFRLPAHAWDIGTMFFVAESLSGVHAEFTLALRAFVAGLRPGAPFAAAFMAGSTGYVVGDRRFPAVAVTAEEIRAVLDELADNVVIHRIDTDAPLREGYEGMVLAVGHAGRAAGGGRFAAR